MNNPMFKHEIPIVAPTPTPFYKDRVDYDRLGRNIEKWIKTDLSGFVLGSHGGEEFHLSDQEKFQILETVVQVNDGRRVIIAGIDEPSPNVAIELADNYKKSGADFVRIRIPQSSSFGRSSEGVLDYFEHLLNNISIPVILIHQPRQCANFDATPEQIGLISQIDGVYAYIISLNFRWENRTVSLLSPKVKVWTCNGSLLFPGALTGATGACLFFANWAPGLCRNIIQLVMSGDYEKARRIQAQIIYADYFGMSKGVAALKHGLNLLGYEATVPRKPTLPLTNTEKIELNEAFKKARII